MTDKELMQMALDALECWQRNEDCNEPMSNILDALRAALAQPEPAECDGGQCGIGGYCKQCPKTQPEPEPVAWMYVNEDGECEQIEYGEVFDDPSVTPLYTAPPQREWQGLTDEEYEAMAEQYVTNCYFNTLKYAKAIEAKLKERNT